MIEHISIPEERINFLKKTSDWRTQLKKFTDADIIITDEVSIKCKDPFMLRRLVDVVKAFGRGFNFDGAMYLLDEDYRLEVIDIKFYSGKSKNRQLILRARLIGRNGTIKKMIEKKCEAKIAVYGKTVSIIASYDNIEKTAEAVEMILYGSKFGTLVRFLKGGFRKDNFKSTER